MIRLWHPLRDPNHCSFRFLLILRELGASQRLSFPRLSLADLFLLFPEYLQHFSFNGMAERRGELRALGLRTERQSYENLPDVRTVYRELETYQRVSLSRLVGKGLLSKPAFESGEAELLQDRLPSKLSEALSTARERRGSQIKFMLAVFSSMRVDGADGIFRRAGIDVPGRFR